MLPDAVSRTGHAGPAGLRASSGARLALVVSLCIGFGLLGAAAAAAAPLHAGALPLPLAGLERPAGKSEPATPELIDAALAAGRIDLARATELRVDALQGRDLPHAFESDTPWEGTLVLVQVKEALPRLSRAERSAVGYPATTASRTNRATPRSTSCGTNSGQFDNQHQTAHFLIEHGTLSGTLDIEDYARALEDSWAKEVAEFGWTAPPVHPDLGGRYNVRLAELPTANVTGFVSDSGTYAAPGTGRSCMVLNTRINEFTDPGGILSSTAAHELTHALQFGMGVVGKVDEALIEGGADWMSQEVFDGNEIGINHLWPEMTDSLAQMGDTNGALGAYKAWYALRGLTERFGVGVAGGGEQVMEDFYEAVAAGSGQMAALRQALSNKGVSLADAYADFAIAAKLGLTCEEAGVPASSGRCFDRSGLYRRIGNEGPAGFHFGHVAISSNNAAGVSAAVKNDYATKWVRVGGAASDAKYGVTLTNHATNAAGRMRATVICRTADGLREITSIPALSPGGTRTVYVDQTGCTADPVVVVTTEDSGDNGNPATPAVLDFTVATGPVSTQTLTVNRGGAGTGRVKSSPAGLSCAAASCAAKFVTGSTVVLHATPTAATSGFAGWSGCGSVNEAGDCVVTMSAARSVTATFSDATDHTLTTTLASPGSGSPGSVAAVTPDDPGFTCSVSPCTQRYQDGVVVRLRAEAGNGFAHSGWTGCGSVDAEDCLVTMSAARGVTATFVSAPGVVPARTLVSKVAGRFDPASGQTNHGENVPALEGYLNNAYNLLPAPNGDWFVALPSAVKRFTIGGNLRTVAGSVFGGESPQDGQQATAGALKTPIGMALDGDGGLVIVEGTGMRIRRVDLATGVISTVIETDPNGLPFDVVALPGGGLVYSDTFTGLWKVDAAGNRSRIGTWSSAAPTYITRRPDGQLLVQTTTGDLLRVTAAGEKFRLVKLPEGTSKLRLLPDGSLLGSAGTRKEAVDGVRVIRITGRRIDHVAGADGGPYTVPADGLPADEARILATDTYPFAGGILLADGHHVRLIDKTSILEAPTPPEDVKSVSIPFRTLQIGSQVTTQCALDSTTNWQPCSSPFTASNLSDGDHTLRVRATDALGTDPTPATVTWRIGRDPSKRRLTVRVEGSGRVFGGQGVDCTSVCTYDLPAGTQVGLSPQPGNGTMFARWEGGGCSNGSCIVTLNEDVSVRAIFEPWGTQQQQQQQPPSGFPPGFTPPPGNPPGVTPPANPPGATPPGATPTSTSSAAKRRLAAKRRAALKRCAKIKSKKKRAACVRKAKRIGKT